MIATAITAFFYLRIVVVMYFADPAKQVPAEQPVEVAAGAAGGAATTVRSPAVAGVAGNSPFVIVPGILTTIVIGVAVIVTLGLGLFPGPVLDLLSIPLPLLS
jgi:NADH-quinone oxidoreductase subunit N